MAPDLHKGLLQGLLGPGLTPQHTQGNAEKFRGGCFVEIRKSPLVAEAAARQQPRQLFRGIPGRGGLNHSAHLLDIKRLTPPGSGPARNLSDTAVRDNGGKAIMGVDPYPGGAKDRKSTRLNSSH